MPLRGARALERIPLIPVGEDAPEVTPSTPRRAPAPTGALTRDGIFAFGILLVVALGLLYVLGLLRVGQAAPDIGEAQTDLLAGERPMHLRYVHQIPGLEVSPQL